jgi:ABC-2 type transport system ATP-binding protein
MRVRLAFAVAIHAKRDILIMDEVLAVGDLAFQKKCLDELKRLRQEGRTVILVSHSPESLEQFCDRVLVLEKGRVVAIDRPDRALDVYSKLLV